MSSSSSSSSSLPPGWENRSNSMSEKDIKLGGIAATKFGNKNIINTAYSDTTIQEAVAVYKTSDEVRDVYLKQMDIQQKQQQANNNSNHSNTENNSENNEETIITNANVNANAADNKQTTTPLFWEERQKTRQLEAEGYRNQDNNNTNNTNTQNSSNSKTINPTIAKASANNNAKLALLRIAIHTLETLADTFEQEQTVTAIPLEDKTAFAKAIQRSMQALATTASTSSTD